MRGMRRGIRVNLAYKRNPSERNLCSGTSIGGDFNCSLTPVFDSNLRETIAPSLIPKSDRTADISFFGVVFLPSIRVVLRTCYVNRDHIAVEVTDADDYEHF